MARPTSGAYNVDAVLGGLFGLAGWKDTSSSCFDAGKWDNFDFEFILENYPRVREMAVRLRESGVDARQAFFALSGKKVTGSGPIADAWQVAIETDAWRRAIRECKSKEDKAVWLQTMLARMEQDAIDGGVEGASFSQVGQDGQLVDLANLPVVTDEDVVARVVEQSEENADDATAIVLLAGSLSGQLDVDTPQEFNDEVMMLASQMDIDLFASLLGSCSRIVRGVSRRTCGGMEEMTGYELSGWTDRIVPQDQLAVANGELHALIRLAEGTLSARKYRSHSPIGKGPVILLRDETASMKYDKIRHRQALAFEVALAQVFNDDGRDLVTVAWGNTKLREHTWGDSECDLGVHLTSFLFANSTRPYRSLIRATEIANEYVDGADILIVTDGQIHTGDTAKIVGSDRLQKRFENFRAAGGRVWAVVVGGTDEKTWKQTLPFADGVIPLNEISVSNGALMDMVAGMADREYGSASRRREIW